MAEYCFLRFPWIDTQEIYFIPVLLSPSWNLSSGSSGSWSGNSWLCVVSFMVLGVLSTNATEVGGGPASPMEAAVPGLASLFVLRLTESLAMFPVEAESSVLGHINRTGCWHQSWAHSPRGLHEAFPVGLRWLFIVVLDALLQLTTRKCISGLSLRLPLC